MNTFQLRRYCDNDREAILGIFNFYVRNSFSAYPETPVPPPFIDHLVQDAISVRIAELDGELVGFGLLKPFLPFSTFRSAATLTYFFSPGRTRSGFGGSLLSALEKDAIEAGISILVVNIASPNTGSIAFHRKNGFSECGRLPAVGSKFNETFDIVWMAKTLDR